MRCGCVPKLPWPGRTGVDAKPPGAVGGGNVLLGAAADCPGGGGNGLDEPCGAGGAGNGLDEPAGGGGGGNGLAEPD
jgi:hypothetical protein